MDYENDLEELQAQIVPGALVSERVGQMTSNASRVILGTNGSVIKVQICEAHSQSFASSGEDKKNEVLQDQERAPEHSYITGNLSANTLKGL